MKTIFTLLLSSLITLSAFGYDGSRLSISTIKNTDLRIEVDGRKYNLKDNTITLSDLAAGRHTIKIYREKKRKNRGIFSRTQQDMIYNNNIYLKQGYHFDITINRFGKALEDEQPISRNDDLYNDDEDYGNGNGGNGNGGYGNGNNSGWNQVMNDRDFNQAKETLRREPFETSRIQLAKQIMDRNYFSSLQVKEMLLLFSYENSRLDLAKYGYDRTTDKKNYFMINDVFSYSSSKDELARFIRNR